MNSTKKTARLADVLYLVNGMTGFFSIIYVPGKLIVSGNAAATANNILAFERLFRLDIVSELICAAEPSPCCTARISCRYSTNHNGKPWPCNSSICMQRDSVSPGFFGACGSSPSEFSSLSQVSSPASWGSC
jgi:hypothetical protein